MSSDHDNRPRRVGEPVQVYLDRSDQQRLERLTDQLDTTKSDVLRRALETLERQLLDPDQHPALQVIGLAAGTQAPVGYDVARDHDRFLADTEPGVRPEPAEQLNRRDRRGSRGRPRAR